MGIPGKTEVESPGIDERVTTLSTMCMMKAAIKIHKNMVITTCVANWEL